MRLSAVLEPMPRRRQKQKLPPPRPGPGFSATAFARIWDKYARAHPELTRAELVDLMRDKVLRFDRTTETWKPVTGTAIYNLRKPGSTPPNATDVVGLALVLGCDPADFVE